MWPVTWALGAGAVVAAAVLLSAPLRDRRAREGTASAVDGVLGALARAADVPVVADGAAVVVVAFAVVGLANVFATNHRSWYLALNGAIAVTIAVAIGAGLWLAAGRFGPTEWRTVRRCVVTVIVACWLGLVVYVLPTPPGAELGLGSDAGSQWGPLQAAVLVTAIGIYWVPLGALPTGLVLGLLVAALRRRRLGRARRSA